MALDQEDIAHEDTKLDHSVMSFGDHLEELRFRLMMALVVVQREMDFPLVAPN